MFSKIMQSFAILGIVFGLVGAYYASAPVPSDTDVVALDTVDTASPQPPPGWQCNLDDGTCTRIAAHAPPTEVAITQTEAAETLDALADLLEDEDDADEGDEMPATTADFSDDPLEIVGTPLPDVMAVVDPTLFWFEATYGIDFDSK